MIAFYSATHMNMGRHSSSATLALMVAINLTILLANPCLAKEPFYYYQDHAGALKFTDEPPQDIPYQVKHYQVPTKPKTSVAKNAAFARHPQVGLSHIRALIQTIAERYNIEPTLVEAVMRVESGYNVMAVSAKGARGLMQLMPQTAASLGVTNIHRPTDNITGGAKLLSLLLRKYNGNLDLALAAYNAGEEAVKRYNGVPPFRETIDYVAKVRKYYWHLAHESKHITHATLSNDSSEQTVFTP